MCHSYYCTVDNNCRPRLDRRHLFGIIVVEVDGRVIVETQKRARGLACDGGPRRLVSVRRIPLELHKNWVLIGSRGSKTLAAAIIFCDVKWRFW